FRRIAVREAARDLVREDEAEPDGELAGEISVAAGKNAASGCEGGSHETRILDAEAGAHHPPIWLIDRDARTNPGSFTRCFSSLCRTAKRRKSAICESVRPSRNAAFKSHSRRENRQVRSCPSAVRRIRLQLEQNGSETGLTKPISPLPSAKRNRRAVDDGFAGTSTSGPYRSSIRVRISPPVSTWSALHARSASSGMNSMKRTTYGLRRASPASAGTSSSVKPLIATQLTLIGRSSGYRSASARPAST